MMHRFFTAKTLGAGMLAATLGLSACSSTIFKKSAIGDYDIISLDAKQRLIISGTRPDGRKVICAEPSPDAIVAQASYLASSAQRLRNNTPTGGPQSTANDNASLNAGSAESVASIAMRTQTIQLLRDGYFRVCEAYLNGAIDEKAYNQVVCHIDTFMATLVAIQSISGTISTPGVAITSGTFTTTSVEAPDGTTTVTTSPNNDASAVLQNVVAAEAGDEESEAIRQILEHYEHQRAANARGAVSVCSHPQAFFPPQYSTAKVYK